jgi:lysophospholipase L1-like esterase
MDPPNACENCTGFITQYADALAASSGSTVTVVNDAVPNSLVADVARHVDEPAVQSDLADADIVVVWVGYNDGPPYGEDTPCGISPGETTDQGVSAVEQYTSECVAETMAEYGDRYSALFSNIASRSPHATSRFALNTFNNWAENPAFDTGPFPESRLAPLLDKVVGILDAWNEAQCSAAEEAGLTCIDVYHAVNGPDGKDAVGPSVGADYTHLSQGGHDAVAALLVAESD